jgi:DNA-binding winged helix-turn-helix (wHTH) protein/TolB-like protein
VPPGAEPAAPGRAWLGIGKFEFDPATGQLRRTDAEPGAAPQRLAPQPAALLALLIERDGDIATRDEIRARIWPDVSVEFDASLHHCVRQVRTALGERASEANYIETSPRRGYRLKCEIRRPAAPQPANAAPAPASDPRTPAAPDPVTASAAPAPASDPRAPAAPDLMTASAAPAPASDPRAPAAPDLMTASAAPALRATVYPRSRRSLLVGGAALAVVVTAAVVLAIRDPAPPRVAILPFADPAMDEATALAVTRLGERVLAGLATELGARCDVLGPRSTAPQVRADRPLRDIARELDADYVVNARWLADRDAPEILVELIRTSDGRHVWVRNFAAAQWDGAVAEVVDGLTTRLLAAD